MPLWSAPHKSIHCYSCPTSMSLSLSGRYSSCFGWQSETPCGGPGLWKHGLWIIMDHNIKTRVTAPFTFLPVVFPLFFPPSVCLFHFSFVPFARLVGLRPWCIQTFVTVGEERSRITAVAPWSRSQIVALCVIKWMMTKHFISAQWVRYSSWGSESYLWWAEWITPVGASALL